MGGLINGIAGLGGGSNQYKATAPTIGFRAKKATLPTTDYSGAITGATGNYGTATAGQNGLVRQLQDQAAGNGPSVVQTQLATSTANNINNAAGAAASARGVSPALAARLAVDNAATANQAAAGQAATLRAQEILAAREQLGNVLGTQAGTAVQALGTAGGLQHGQGALELQNQLGTEGINAGIATADAANNLAAQGINAGVAQQNAQIGASMFGGLLQGGGAALAALAHGGEVPGDGPKKPDQELARKVHSKLRSKAGKRGATPTGEDARKLSDTELAAQVTLQRYFKNAPKHAAGAVVGDALYGMGRGLTGDRSPWPAPRNQPAAQGVPALLARPAEGGIWTPTPIMTSAPVAAPSGPASAIGKLLGGVGASLQPRPTSPGYATGGGVRPMFFSRGTPEVVPGRANIPEGHDSERADKVPAWLSPGEIVIPRSAAQAPDAPEKARSFVAHLVKSRGASGYRRVAEAKKRARA